MDSENEYEYVYEYESETNKNSTTNDDDQTSSGTESEEDTEDSEDLDQDIKVGTIIGINKPSLSYESPPLLFYVRIDCRSYKSCRWATKEEVCSTGKGSFLYKLYVNKHSTFQKYESFKTNDIYPSNEKFDLYVPLHSNFDEGHLIPDYAVASKVSGNRSEYLIKWRSLDILQSTWEMRSDVPIEIINEYRQKRKISHPICFDLSNNTSEPKFHLFKESPTYKNGNKITEYQIEGLNWLQNCWFQRKNSILSDEMGLGKTIESITVLIFLSICYRSWGPFLVVCPLSTVTNWLNEFKKWTNFNVVSLSGDKKSRKMIKDNLIYCKDIATNKLDKKNANFDVLVVSYEWLNFELKFIKQFKFMYTIIDEAQRIKNAKTTTYKNCCEIRSHHFLLMTGTPIQNNLFEIWSLLHFIDPDQFNDYEKFESNFPDKENPETIEKLQEVLQPFIFRRKKNDVKLDLDLPEKEEIIIEVEMTQVQRTFSQLFYKDNLSVLKESLNKINLNNFMIQLRKIFCHPFLFPEFESICHSQYKEAHNIPQNQELSNDDEMKSLILASGKMILIDKLLPKLKEGNHKVLFFSQFTSVLDIIEDYLTYKNYAYERLDGQCSTISRTRSIDKFQNDEDTFIFLLSTRAGGLGINLTKADIVIIYDSDWNPQNDVQAQARCHRIGQSKKVRIYRLITRASYESEMFLRVSKKLALDYAILDSAPKGNDANNNKIDFKKELEMILKKGAYYIFKDDSSEIDKFCSENIDQILENRSHTVKDVVSGGNSKFSKASFDTNESDIYQNDFWDKLVENPNEKEEEIEFLIKEEENTKMKTRKKKVVNYCDTIKRPKRIKKGEVEIKMPKEDDNNIPKEDDNKIPKEDDNNIPKEDDNKMPKEDDNKMPKEDDNIIPKDEGNKNLINCSEPKRSQNDNKVINHYQNIVHFTPEVIENDSDLKLEELKLSDFCDADSFGKSITTKTYEKVLSILRSNGIGLSSLLISKSMHEICKTLVVYSFFGMPIDYRNLYYSYVKEFIPDFSKQIQKTPFKELNNKFNVSVCDSEKLEIMNEIFNWDVLYKIALFITNEKLPKNFQFAPEISTFSEWTPNDDFIALTSYLFAEKHTDFLEDENLPFKAMIERNPSLKSWILSRIQLIFYELYLLLPKEFHVYDKERNSVPKKIGDFKKFSRLNQHIFYSKRLTIQTQKKLLRILFFYGIPTKKGISKIQKILNDEFINKELILIFTVKLLIKSIKYQNNLINLLKSLPKIDFNSIQKNDLVDISWIKETAIMAVASNLDLIYKVRENCKILNDAKYKSLNKKLGKWTEIGKKLNWWDFQCDIVLFNVTSFYGFFFNSMLCYYLIPTKPFVFQSIDEDDVEDWKEQELRSLEPIIIQEFECLKPIFSFELKEKRVRKINELIEKFEMTESNKMSKK